MIAANTEAETVPRSVFAKEMGARRDRLGLSRARASRRAGISIARWSQIEQGYEARSGQRLPANPSRPTVWKIARALKWDIRDALAKAGFDPDDTTPDAIPEQRDHEEIIQLIDGMPPHVQEGIKTLLRTMHDTSVDVDLSEYPKAS